MSLVEPMRLRNSVSDDCGLPSLSLVLKHNIHGCFFYNIGMFVFFYDTRTFFRLFMRRVFVSGSPMCLLLLCLYDLGFVCVVGPRHIYIYIYIYI